jgi:hypothetical protein
MTVISALFAVVKALVESVAVNVHAPAVSMTRSENVATPPTAATAVTPESLHTEVSVMVSASPFAFVMVAPLPASTATVKVEATPAVTEPVGCDLNPTCVGVSELIATVVVAVPKVWVLSVAVKTHAVPAVMITLLNVATPLAVVAVSVPVKVHPDVAVVIPMVSDDSVVFTLPVGPTTETWNVGSGTE